MPRQRSRSDSVHFFSRVLVVGGRAGLLGSTGAPPLPTFDLLLSEGSACVATTSGTRFCSSASCCCNCCCCCFFSSFFRLWIRSLAAAEVIFRTSSIRTRSQFFSAVSVRGSSTMAVDIVTQKQMLGRKCFYKQQVLSSTSFARKVAHNQHASQISIAVFIPSDSARLPCISNYVHNPSKTTLRLLMVSAG